MENIKPIKVLCICYANYCRSPVAERIMRKLFINRVESDSAGLRPIARSGMDDRSLNYLKSKGYDHDIHVPKSVTSSLINNADIVFALDAGILMQLNKIYSSSKNKFKLLNYKNPKVLLSDPFHMDEEAYMTIMERIEQSIINLEM